MFALHKKVIVWLHGSEVEHNKTSLSSVGPPRGEKRRDFNAHAVSSDSVLCGERVKVL